VLLAKRLDLDASRTRLKKAENQSPEKVQQVCSLFNPLSDSTLSLASKIVWVRQSKIIE
jgi:hypothetical protein